MITRLLALAGGLALVALVVPDLTSTYLDRRDQATAQDAQRAAPVTAAKYASGKSIVLEADPTGHFFGTFRINGRAERGLVDTGASTIAINTSAARRFGISVGSLAFVARAQTANGIVEAAYVRLDRVEIDSITLKNVDAMVLPDKALSGMLVGMSFLSRLSSYRVENGALHLIR
ncbi:MULTISPECIES: TIGR02281 family clan AA aspartic protease [unclassified Sinorhizobium]|uniref:retropepsin-like aspartic protease family protein n=1 Tax=unclassified Sinorhizobium TaxID=2613772 RepID=UPI0024C46B11|nr:MULTISPECIES: TIGR02281 family clan AA aspartic protease [unclassified Sinorhizobium]MDK1377426.1 TIGR02281 family clan AA aspartic protease [Sinorhizobium sp. 6-70]MDK1477667.1 TIGR02281 family clan AA aspartic protease [Sinorhizobium sp. 6-117]